MIINRINFDAELVESEPSLESGQRRPCGCARRLKPEWVVAVVQCVVERDSLGEEDHFKVSAQSGLFYILARGGNQNWLYCFQLKLEDQLAAVVRIFPCEIGGGWKF